MNAEHGSDELLNEMKLYPFQFPSHN